MLIRAARKTDYDAFCRLFPELQTGDLVPERAVWKADLLPSTLVVEDEGQVVAYADAVHIGASARVRQIVVDPELRGRGVGRRLLLQLAERARAAGCTQWELNVLPGNAPAIALYESLGLRRESEAVALRISWALAETLPVGEGLSARRIEPAEEAALEARFGLVSGRLAHLRTRPAMHLFVVESAGGPEGLAAFAATFPGALPFVATSAEAAAVLLRAMQPHTRSDVPWVRVVLEDNEPVAQQLVARGATVYLRTLRMTGPLPA